MSDLTPYDTGARAEPKVWPASPGYPDGYGKVDFDNDESATIATVWIERAPEGGYSLQVDDHGNDIALPTGAVSSPEVKTPGIYRGGSPAEYGLWRLRPDGVWLFAMPVEGSVWRVAGDQSGDNLIPLGDLPH